ncbi:MAG: glycosyltransferase family 2 protein [Lachnospiraceae bacterium]|nr:glycosyltransferase family 2 protein [Lachnospiraceae bacterium]
MKLTPYKIKKGIRYLKHYGPKAFWNRLRDKMEPQEVPYGPWFEKYRAKEEELSRQRKQGKKFDHQPLISLVVPCYQTPEKYLLEMLDSVQNQSYENWQLCLADATPSREVEQVVKDYCEKYQEGRIQYQRLEKNLGISENTNAGIGMAKGEWVGLLDHDDLLAPEALYEVASLINQEPLIEVIYSDEDQVEDTRQGLEHKNPHFKPDFSLDLLRSNNYITHFFCVKKTVLEQAGGLRKEFDGAQDYDLILRCTEIAKKTGHISKILYHWRVHSHSTADNPLSKTYAYEAGKKALEEHLRRTGVQGKVSQLPHFGFYRVVYDLQGEPLVSILIPNKDQPATLRRCIDSIQRSTYQNYEIIIIENNSTDPEIFAYYQELLSEQEESCHDSLEREGQRSQGKGFSGGEGILPEGQKVKIVVWDSGFNYSAINNFGASHAQGDALVLLNNDVEMITPNWMEEMLGNCQRQEVGIVGARLYYPDNTIQHAGIVIGIDGIAANMFPGLRRGQEGYFHKAALQLNYSAVTAACMMVSKEVFEQLQGLEEKLAVAFNDVDFCLRARQAGYLVVYDPFVEAYHYESKSRGKEDTKEKIQRFGEEIEFIRTRWKDILREGDPYYNLNFSLKKCNYALKP